MQGISFVVAPIRDHAFFKQAVLEGQVGHAFLQRTGFPAQILDLAGGCGTGGIAGEPALARFHELLRPGVVQALGDPFLAAQFSNAVMPRRPSSTIRILSSAEKCRRVARRMSFTTCSAGAFTDFFKEDLGFIFVPSSLRRSP